MKTKDLIKKLNEIDPGGDMEVCIENRDICGSIYSLPAYYDGRLQRASKRSENGFAQETTVETSGHKIILNPIDLFDLYTDSIIEDGEEYPIKTSGGLPHDYSWLEADWTASKVNWLIWSEKYIKEDISRDRGLVDESDKKLKLISDLKEGYIKSTTDALKRCAKKNFKRKQSKSAIELVNKLTDKRPIILDIFRGGSDYVAITGASWRKHEFNIYENGIVKHRDSFKEEWKSIDLESFSFDDIFEEFDELQNKKYS